MKDSVFETQRRLIVSESMQNFLNTHLASCEMSDFETRAFSKIVPKNISHKMKINCIFVWFKIGTGMVLRESLAFILPSPTFPCFYFGSERTNVRHSVVQLSTQCQASVRCAVFAARLCLVVTYTTSPRPSFVHRMPLALPLLSGCRGRHCHRAGGACIQHIVAAVIQGIRLVVENAPSIAS